MSRRRLFRSGGWLTAAGLLPARFRALAAPGKGLEVGPTLYESIGVKPVINARGTFTILTGSQTLPEVKKAMDEASRHFVHMDELMKGVGQRLAELTKAEYGIVTAGCAAALAHATAACMAGADPEKMQRLPHPDGMRNEVVVPRTSRNVYDHAVRMTGAKMVTVDSVDAMQAALGPNTAMIMLMASPQAERGPLSMDTVIRMAREKNIPVIVDAAAETLTIPNKYLQRGATMVTYSGGKILRGPQAAGLLLGPQKLLWAAWLNSAPHHAFGRSMKVGKEEIMGMLAAVEAWVKRDHDADWKMWESWLAEIGNKVSRVDGVTTEVLQPEDLSNHAPQLRVKWQTAKLGIGGADVQRILQEGSPRIVVAGGSGRVGEAASSSVTIMPYMLNPGEYRIVADALHAVLAKPPAVAAPARDTGPLASVGGQWDVQMEYTLGEARHQLNFAQNGQALTGTHRGDALSGDLRGTVDGSTVKFRSAHRYEGTVLTYEFTGRATNDRLEGTVALGEYGTARWTATRRA